MPKNARSGREVPQPAAERLEGSEAPPVRPVALDEIDRGTAHIRSYVDEEDLQELAASIEAVGLLQPIVVMEKDKVTDGLKYDLLIGQRRFEAHRRLGRTDIMAKVVPHKSEREAIAASLAENLCREKLSQTDAASAVTKLYQLHGKDIKRVQQATGIWPETIRRYIALEECGSPHIKTAVDERKISLLDAKNALQAAHDDIRIAEGIVNAMVDKGMTRSQKRRLTSYVQEHPDDKLESAITDATRARVERRLAFDLTTDIQKGLQKATDEWHMDPEDIAAQALREWLHDQGYID